jgi:hypothetical protein
MYYKQSNDYQLYAKIILDGLNVWLFSGEQLITPNATNITGLILTNLPSTFGQQFNFKTFETSISNISFEIVNGKMSNGTKVSEYFYNLFWNKNLINAKVEIYQHLNLTDTKLYTGFITKFTPADVYETAYKIEIEDVTRKMTQSALIANYFDKESLLTYRPANFVKIARRAKAGVVGAITGITNFEETNNQILINNTWKAESQDWWYVLIGDHHPIDHIIYLFDDMDIDFEKYDTANFVDIRDNELADITSFHYEYKEPIENAYKYIIEQCLVPCRCYPFVNVDGKLTLKTVKQPSALDTITTIDENNTVEINRNQNSIDNIVNIAIVKYELDAERNVYVKSLVNYDDDAIRQSIERFDLQPRGGYMLEINGLNRNSVLSVNADIFATTISDYIFNRLGDSIKTINVQILIETAKTLEVGDFVFFENTKLIQWRYLSDDLGKRGIIDSADINFAIIDVSFWGDYTTNVETNNVFIDTLEYPDNFYNLVWNRYWYIEEVANKAVPEPVKNVLPLPLDKDMTVDRQIKLETFEDLLTSYKLNENFLFFHKQVI